MATRTSTNTEGRNRIADLVEPYLWVYGCSVDPTTGNLAVASVNWLSAASWVAVYSHAKGTPQNYEDPAIINYVFCGYDDKGTCSWTGRGKVAGLYLLSFRREAAPSRTLRLGFSRYAAASGFKLSSFVIPLWGAIVNVQTLHVVVNPPGA